MIENLPDKLRIDISTVTNREWLWLEERCRINVAKMADEPMKMLMSFRALAVRRWQVENGQPATATFDESADGLFDSIDFGIDTPEAGDAADPTQPADAG